MLQIDNKNPTARFFWNVHHLCLKQGKPFQKVKMINMTLLLELEGKLQPSVKTKKPAKITTGYY